MLYAPTGTMRESKPVEIEQDEALEMMRKACPTDDTYLFAARSQAITSIYWVHSLQHHAHSMGLNTVVDLTELDKEPKPYEIFNLILPAGEAFQSMLTAKSPERTASPTTDDEKDIRAAEYTAKLMEWGYERFGIKALSLQAANLLFTTGNVFIRCGWDPSGGRQFQSQDGRMLFEGEPVCRAESMFAWSVDPGAKTLEDAEFVYCISSVSRDGFLSRNPALRDRIDRIPTALDGVGQSGESFQRLLQNLTVHQGSIYGTRPYGQLPKGADQIEIHEIYRRDSPRYPQGFMGFAIGQLGYPIEMIHAGENPYINWETERRTFPIVHIKDVAVPERFLGESRVIHVIPPQRYANEVRGQIKANGDRLGNPQLTYVMDGVAPQSMTNRIGGHIPRAPGSDAPEYIRPPDLPEYLQQGIQDAVQVINFHFAPFGPNSMERDANIRSGFHQTIVEEEKQQKTAMLMDAWTDGWSRFWRLFVHNWITFATLPVKITTLGTNNALKSEYMMPGEDLSRNVVVRVTPGSAVAASKTAVFAQWMELLKALQASGQPPAPEVMHQMWNDLDKAHMARTYRDTTADVDKAHRNLQLVRRGETVVADSFDSPDIHIAIISAYMKTEEYEQLVLKDKGFEGRMEILYQTFNAMKEQQILAMQMQAARAMALEQSAVQEASPDKGGGDGGVARRTQGMGRTTSPKRAERQGRQGK